jgi:hypothetical protein
MQKGSTHIIFAGVTAGFVSTIYFLLLMTGLPFVAIAAIIGAIAIVVGWGIFKYNKDNENSEPLSRFKHLILGIGIVYFVTAVYPHAERYGGWDAWSIWNYHARFLAHPENWQKMTWYRICHPDYPMLVPGFAGFFARLMSEDAIELISFVFSFTTSLFIPVLIFLEIAPRSVVLGSAAYFLLLGNDSFLAEGVSQYADTTLAFFFLCGLVAVKYAQVHTKYVFLAACSLGCCLWTKNEGIVLVFFFVLFNFRELMFEGRWKYSLLGVSIPLLTLIWYKTAFAPPNGMIAEQSANTLVQLTDGNRYTMIWYSFVKNINEHFGYIKLFGLAYVISLLLGRGRADKRFLMVLSCFVAYFMIYVITVEDLKWHLFTSQNRLTHQLMPSLLYVICDNLLSTPERETVYAS